MPKQYARENRLTSVCHNGTDIAFYFGNVYDNQINLIDYAKLS